MPWSSQGWHVYTELDRLLFGVGDNSISWHRFFLFLSLWV